jgi:hypothetical protein
VGTVTCKKCGKALDGLLDLPFGERTPCPQCGSTSRAFQESATVKVGMHVGASASRSTQDQLDKALDEVLDTLPPKERKLLRLRHGLEDGTSRTLKEVAKEFKVTPERIRQIEARALRMLMHPTRWIVLQNALGLEGGSRSTVELTNVLETTERLTPHLVQYLKQHESELSKLPWDIFEHLIAEFFASWGYEDVRLVGRDPRTAADIYALRKADPSGIPIRYFVEVKRRKNRIGVEVIDGVYGAFSQERPTYGWHAAMIVSVAGFKDFQRYTCHELALKGVELRGYDDIKKWLADYKPSDKGLWLPNPLRNLP